MAGSGRRFALEAVFLAGLGVAVGLAGLSTGRIIGVMALGWLLTALVELVSWRLAVRHPTGVAVAPPVTAGAEPHADQSALVAEPPPTRGTGEPVAEEEPAAQEEAEPESEVEEAPVAEAEPESEAEEVPVAEAGPQPDAQGDASGDDDAEPPRERRRGFWRRRPEPQKSAPGPPPRHVRLIPKPPDESDGDADAMSHSAERAEGA
jgi:hypothetical protein